MRCFTWWFTAIAAGLNVAHMVFWAVLPHDVSLSVLMYVAHVSAVACAVLAVYYSNWRSHENPQ